MRQTPIARACGAARGFSLIELMVGIVVSSIVLAGVAAAIIASQAAVEGENDINGAVSGARNGLAYLERVVRMAGYGVDARFAFDLAPPSGSIGKDNYAETGFTTDDLAFRYRDPAFLVRARVDTPLTTVTLDAATPTVGVDLAQGQALALICPGGQDYLVVRLSSATASSAVSASVTAYGPPFSTVVPSCLVNVSGEQAGFATLMYDVRIRVMPVGGVPHLVVLYGFGNPATTNFAPIVANVSDFQVAYMMNRPPRLPDGGTPCPACVSPDVAGNNNWILGDDSADPLPSWDAGAPAADDDYGMAVRFTAHPANIRGVRLSLTTYGEPNARVARRSFFVQAENSTMVDAGNERFVTTSSTAIRLPNMMSRAFFVPPLTPSGSTADLNAWGG